MEQKINDLTQRINSLSELFNVLHQNVQFNITLIISVLAFAVTVTGAALVILAKFWVNKRVDEELGKFDERIKRIIEDNPQFYWATIKATPIKNEIEINGLIGQENLTLDFPTQIQVQNQWGMDLNFEATINEKGNLVVKLKNYDPKTDGMVISIGILWLRKRKQ
jgi:hypothetical protein